MGSAQFEFNSRLPIGRQAAVVNLIVLAVATVAITGLTKVGQGAEVDPEVLQRLRTEGVPAWQQLENSYGEIEFTVTFEQDLRYVDNDGKKQDLHREFLFRRQYLRERNCMLVEQDYASGIRIIKAINPEYRFEIHKKNESPAWVLAKAGTPPDQLFIDTTVGTWENFSWLVNGDAALSVIVNQSDVFRIDEAQMVTSDSDGTIVRLKATNLEPSTKKFDYRERHGLPGVVYSVRLDPTKDWSIVHFDQQFPKNHQGNIWHAIGDIEYQDRDNGPAIPELISVRMYNGATKFNPEEPDEVSTTRLEVSQPISNEAEFYLPHYGIDDSAIRGDTRGRLWRFAYFIIGVASLVIAWRVLKGRSQSASV